MLLTQGKLDEADPLLVEAVACGRGRHTAAAALYYNGALVEPAAGPGAGAAGRGGVEAEQDRSRWSWVGAGHAGGRRTLGRGGAAPGHPRGRGDRRAARRSVVERRVEFLGAAHQDTLKWQRVLEGMSLDFELEQ